MLAEVWRVALECGPVGVDRTFAELGGTPAQLARMVERVADACGEAVPVELRHPELTIEQLAAALRGDGRPGRRRPPVCLERNVGAQATRRPLFFFHGDYGGGGLYCLQLAIHLGREQPLYAIAPHGMEGEPLPPSIEAMAADRIGLVRERQRHGPYRLGGHCNGAAVALELARLLVASGEEVERLLLVAPVLFPPTDIRRRRIAARIRRIAGLPPRELAAAVAGRLGRRLRRRRQVEVGAPPAVLTAADSPPRAAPASPIAAAAETWAAVHDAYSRVMRAYRPAPYPGAVTVLQPLGDASGSALDQAGLWAQVAARAKVHPIPGEHLSCVTVHVRELATRLRASLDGGEG